MFFLLYVSDCENEAVDMWRMIVKRISRFGNKRLENESNKTKKLNANGTTVNHNTIGLSEFSSQPWISSYTSFPLSTTIIKATIQEATCVTY
jgi:hypothetical protein